MLIVSGGGGLFGDCMFAGTLLRQLRSTKDVWCSDVVCKTNCRRVSNVNQLTQVGGVFIVVLHRPKLPNPRIKANLDTISLGEKDFLCGELSRQRTVWIDH